MSDSRESIRIFVGVRISLAAVQDLIDLVESMQPMARSGGATLRWVAPATYHITLKFLGHARREVVPALRDALNQAVDGVEPFDIGMKGVGAFPADKKARVVWAGIRRGKDWLDDLARRVDQTTAEIGFEKEKRPFHPHVTLARVRDGADLTSLVLAFSEETFSKSRIDSVVLFESSTAGKKTEYKALAEFPLGQQS